MESLVMCVDMLREYGQSYVWAYGNDGIDMEWRLAFYDGSIMGILFGAHETHPLNGGACRMGCGWCG